jgi:hypothetical protein
MTYKKNRGGMHKYRRHEKQRILGEVDPSQLLANGLTILWGQILERLGKDGPRYDDG